MGAVCGVDLRSHDTRALMAAAIARAKISLPGTGRGQLIIRPVSGKRPSGRVRAK